MPTSPRKPLLVNLAWTAAHLLFPLGYILSYAPMYRWKQGPDPPPSIIEDERGNIVYIGPSGLRTIRLRLHRYAPVEWLIDNTLLSRPMLWWGDVWGCGETMRDASDARRP